MKQLSNGISKMEKYLAIILMFSMAIIVTVAVVFRYFLNSPLSWAGEVSVFLLIWISFIGGSLGLKYKSQASVTILTDYLPEKVQKVLAVISHIFMLLFLFILLYFTYRWIFSPGVTFQKSSAMLLPMWIPYSAVPLGLTCAAIHLFANLLDLFRKETAQ